MLYHWKNNQMVAGGGTVKSSFLSRWIGRTAHNRKEITYRDKNTSVLKRCSLDRFESDA